jgi:hypothetical protein
VPRNVSKSAVEATITPRKAESTISSTLDWSLLVSLHSLDDSTATPIITGVKKRDQGLGLCRLQLLTRCGHTFIYSTSNDMDSGFLDTFLRIKSPANDTIHLTPREALSGISGSISLAAWVFLLVILPFSKAEKYADFPKLPQLVENYKQGSAEGISLLFLAVWFIGDLANLFGKN